MNKSTTYTSKKKRNTCPQTHGVGYFLSCSERHLFSSRLGTPSSLIPFDTYNMRYLIFSYFNLGPPNKEVLIPSQGCRLLTKDKE